MTDAVEQIETNANDGVDLYAVLGVHKDATTHAIRMAYRDKAKILHPDVPDTGNKVKFNQLRLARDILTNPKWRENYDAVGVIEQDQADNALAEVLTALTGMFGQVMHSILSEGKDPARGDFVSAMHQAVKAGFESTNKTLTQLESSRFQLNRLVGRFKVKSLEHPNHMEIIVAGQVLQIARQIEQLHNALRQLESARIYLNDIRFEQEA